MNNKIKAVANCIKIIVTALAVYTVVYIGMMTITDFIVDTIFKLNAKSKNKEIKKEGNIEELNIAM